MDNKIFDFDNYKKYLLSDPKNPNSGKKIKLREFATHLKIQPTRLSQILRSSYHFTTDQACKVCNFLGLTNFETTYFLALLNQAQAKSLESKQYFEAEIQRLKSIGRSIDGVVPDFSKIERDAIAEFYSAWFYSAIRLCVGIPELRTVEKISKRLVLPLEVVKRVLLFLEKQGLVKKEGSSYFPGPSFTFTTDLIQSKNHRANWLNRAAFRTFENSEFDLDFVMPGSVSKKDAKKIQDFLMSTVNSVSKTIKESTPEEELYALTLTWLKI